MHASTFRTQMNEETFQILLRVMEKHFETLKILDVEPNSKLSSVVKVSEVPCARRVTVGQSYQSGYSGNLIRQYSCEEIFDQHSNTRQVKVSEVLRAGNEEHKKTWQSTIPYFGTHRNRDYYTENKRNMLMTNGVEYMDVDDNSPPGTPTFSLKSLTANDATLQKEEKPFTLLNNLPYSKIHEITKESKANTLLSNSGSQSLPHGKSVKLAEQKIEADKNSEYQDIKKKFRPLVAPKLEVKNTKKIAMGCNCWMFTFFILLPISILLMAAIIYQDEFTMGFKCQQSGYYINASKALQENIYGQEQAVSTLINFLQKNSCFKIIALVGGIGVGKTYSGQIIAENFPNETHVFSYYPPLTSEIDSEQLSKTYCNLIIIDNLRERDIQEAITFINSIEHGEDRCVTVLAIFNMQNVDTQLKRKTDLQTDVKVVEQAFSSQNGDVKVIDYEKLSEEALEDCIKDAGRQSNIVLTDDNVKDIKQSLQMADTGCKGAYSKVRLVGTSRDL